MRQASFAQALYFAYVRFRLNKLRAPDKVRIFISKMPISSPNPMFDHLLESSHRDDSNKWSNIGFGEEITLVESIEVHFTHLIWSSATLTFSSYPSSVNTNTICITNLVG